MNVNASETSQPQAALLLPLSPILQTDVLRREQSLILFRSAVDCTLARFILMAG
jgi:hypothetical protein